MPKRQQQRGFRTRQRWSLRISRRKTCRVSEMLDSLDIMDTNKSRNEEKSQMPSYQSTMKQHFDEETQLIRRHNLRENHSIPSS
jgi:hypothetical protein